ncbi:MAG: nicotinamide-nucleotide amidohydrolase family protein [Thermodesulfobacteriota bacterium]
MNSEETSAVKELADLLKEKGLTLAVAESCTGGLLGHLITSEPGVSAFFKGSVVAYANSVKVELLGVPFETIEEFGAVSIECAEAMAKGAREKLKSDIGVSITGIAGPEGGSKDKPVGTVFISLSRAKETITEMLSCVGNRGQIKAQAALSALSLIRKVLKSDAL